MCRMTPADERAEEVEEEDREGLLLLSAALVSFLQ